MELTIECQKRPEGSKPNALRRQGLTPAVLYGHNGAESIELTVETRVAERMLKYIAPRKTVVQVNVPDLWSGKVCLQEVQTHPWRGSLYHLSFFAQK